jgi:sialic acid synthase SpsE
VDTIKDISKSELVVMHCTAAYPTPDDQANLSLIPKIAQRYNCVTGFSDHTEGIEISLAALALGVQVIEKHFTIDRKLPGGDNEISILPSELKCLIKQGKRVVGALGQDDKIVYPCEKNCNDFARRSLYARVDLPEGYVLTADNILIRRPSGGIPADNYFDCLGKKITRAIKKDMPITLNDIE